MQYKQLKNYDANFRFIVKLKHAFEAYIVCSTQTRLRYVYPKDNSQCLRIENTNQISIGTHLGIATLLAFVGKLGLVALQILVRLQVLLERAAAHPQHNPHAARAEPPLAAQRLNLE